MTVGWVRAPHWVTREAVPAFGLTPPQIAVYAVLRDRADEHGVTFPGQDLIARESGQSPRAVRAALKRLIEVGLVEVVSRGTKQGNRYRVGMRPPLSIPASPAAFTSAPTDTIPAPPASDSGTSCLSIEAPDAYEVDPGKKTQEVDPLLKPPSRGRRLDDLPASPRQLAFIGDLTRALDYEFPSVESREHANDLITEYWHEMERRRAEGEPLDGSITDLSPAGQRYARRHGLTFTDREEGAR
ncbi:helix-turn-helix domain-containing protein [Microbacterium arborescens]|uniref:helix-turn-helix domain-containing protein n=1 Tax=Microbacterium arborescens TaxID=33883 RepID=UPI0025A0D008|nr:helix-turn-helix domain-containing protein [Microbacterium arborescens]WJM16026.1 helix-turn-helix domain-containing protein [Microbacterium arborescens]